MLCHVMDTTSMISTIYGLVPVSDLNFIEDTSGNLILNYTILIWNVFVEPVILEVIYNKTIKQRKNKTSHQQLIFFFLCSRILKWIFPLTQWYNSFWSVTFCTAVSCPENFFKVNFMKSVFCLLKISQIT